MFFLDEKYIFIYIHSNIFLQSNKLLFPLCINFLHLKTYQSTVLYFLTIRTSCTLQIDRQFCQQYTLNYIKIRVSVEHKRNRTKILVCNTKMQMRLNVDYRARSCIFLFVFESYLLYLHKKQLWRLFLYINTQSVQLSTDSYRRCTT